jgi:outer membrane lipoprotein SlyB
MMCIARTVALVTALTAALGIGGCVSQTVKSTSVPPLDYPSKAVSDAEVLDVGVAILDPGIGELTEDEPVYPEVRRAESTFIANQLTKTLQEVGAWGAVRVVPDTQQFTDLLVSGEILHSDGEKLELAVRVSDARGILWIDKTYSGTTSRYAYDGRNAGTQDPFLMVYRNIANDMLRVFAALNTRDRLAIRQVAELRFARSFSEDAFGDYLEQDKKGTYRIKRLPADSDPMLERVRNLRQRNYVFVDTLQGYYGGFADEMYTPYQEWRKLSYEEVVALRELESESNTRLLAGAAAIVAGIAAQGSSSEYANAAGVVGIIGGASVLKSGLEKRAEASIHSLALEELSQSLEAEITPRVIELEDRTVRLSGNVEDQYAQWRELMADIYATEIGNLEPVTPESSQ